MRPLCSKQIFLFRFQVRSSHLERAVQVTCLKAADNTANVGVSGIPSLGRGISNTYPFLIRLSNQSSIPQKFTMGSQ